MTRRFRQAAVFSRLLAHYGGEVDYGGDRHRAFVQPVHRTEHHGRQSQPTALGAVDETVFLYLGDPSHPLAEGEELAWRGQALVVTQCHFVWAAGEPVYQWATLRAAL